MVNHLTVFSAAVAVVARAAAQATGPVVQINPNQKYQTYDGTGVAEAFQRSLVIHELDTEAQDYVLDLLFSNTTGAGFTILRNGLGSSPTDPFDHMKSIAPIAPASNSSQVVQSPDP